MKASMRTLARPTLYILGLVALAPLAAPYALLEYSNINTLHRYVVARVGLALLHTCAEVVEMQATPVTLKASQRGAQLKAELKKALEPVKYCGIFGLQAAELTKIKDAVQQLEVENPLIDATQHLDLLAGQWNVLFSTIKVTGSRRVKLGLRDLVHIGALTQEIDVASKTAVSRVGFNVPAFAVRNGELVMQAGYEIASPDRVSISLQSASLVPQRLRSLFEANFDLLLSIFNPEGYLDITYCDEQLRCGRDDKGNIFVLERTNT